MVKENNLVLGVLDRLDKFEKIPDIFLKTGLAYAGYLATGNIGGAITALVGLRLAEGNNLAGGVAGVAALTLVGLANAFPIDTGDPGGGAFATTVSACLQVGGTVISRMGPDFGPDTACWCKQ